MIFQIKRIKLILSIFLIELVVSIILRSFFLIDSWPEINHNVSDISKVYSIGLIYDLTFLFYFNSCIIIFLFSFPHKLYQKKFFYYCFQILLAIMLSIFLFSTIAEWFFWDEFNVRFNFIAVDYLIYGTEVIKNIKESYPFKTIIFLMFVSSGFILFFPRKKVYQCFIAEVSAKIKLLTLSTYFLLLILFGVFVNQKPREFNPNNYIKELSSNGPYQFFFSYKNNKINYRQFYKIGEEVTLSPKLLELILKEDSIDYRKNYQLNDDEKLSSTLTQLTGQTETKKKFSIQRKIAPIAEAHKYNVILISVESLSASFLKKYGNQKNITPYLDQILETSLSFNNFYATGTRTVRGLESISLAIPPTPGQAIVRRPDNKGFHSLGSVFNEQGYESVFFYGGNGYFDNMNDFFSGNGYRIIDKTDFKSDEKTFENAWGLADEDLFNRSLKEADLSYDKNQLFFYHIMTVSNHKPYSYPDNKIDIPSYASRDGAVKYTDYAIGKFMETAKTKPWYNKTMFVIVADHCASSAGKIGLDVNTYHIPFMIHCPSLVKPGEVSKLSSQIDIAPTILSLLNFKYTSYFFGDDILSNTFKERAFISNYQKMGYLKNNILCILSPQQLVEFYSYDGKDMKLLKTPNQKILDETMAYYQGADYILENHLFRTTPKLE